MNLSYESLDLKVSREFGDVLRLYAGGGYLFDQEPSTIDPWSIQYGLEFISPWPDRSARWRPIAAIDLQHREQNDWSADLSARVGVQFDGGCDVAVICAPAALERGHVRCAACPICCCLSNM